MFKHWKKPERKRHSLVPQPEKEKKEPESIDMTEYKPPIQVQSHGIKSFIWDPYTPYKPGHPPHSPKQVTEPTRAKFEPPRYMYPMSWASSIEEFKEQQITFIESKIACQPLPRKKNSAGEEEGPLVYESIRDRIDTACLYGVLAIAHDPTSRFLVGRTLLNISRGLDPLTPRSLVSLRSILMYDVWNTKSTISGILAGDNELHHETFEL
ncbi:hypothetical protein V8F20_009070 [Naviculisporaceae sp. PSN 640]